MAPKRGKAKEVAVEVPAAEVTTKKKGGKAAKEIPAIDDEIEAKNGHEDTKVEKNGSKRSIKETGNGDAHADSESNTESVENSDEAKIPAKRGRKAKVPAEKKTKAPKKDSDDEKDVPEEVKEDPMEEDDEIEETEVVPKPAKRGRKPAAKKEEVAKKEEPKQETASDESPAESVASNSGDEVEEKEEPETKPAKRGRAAKKEPAKSAPVEKKASKRGAKNEEKAEPAKKKGKTLANKSSTDFHKIDFGCLKKSPSGKLWNFKISSWNVDGIRAWLNKGGLEFIDHEKPDIFCLQETKCSQDKLPTEVSSVPGYHPYWKNGDKDGYAGVGIYTKKMAISVEYGLGDQELDSEGRIITAEYEQFYLICTYVPNSGRGLVTLPKRLQWNKVFLEHVKALDAKKPVIVCGDMNVSHLEIDLANPKTNKKNAGFTKEERDGMTEFLENGFIDTFRNLYPDKTGEYTFWTYMSNCRAKNVGWRLDYAIVSERLLPAVCENVIRNEVFGSDHCPVTLFLSI